MDVEAFGIQNTMLQEMQQMQNIVRQGTAIEPHSANGNINFTDTLRATVNNINQQQNVAADMTAAFDAGEQDDLVGTMVASQKASLSFSALMQVRNKLMTGFDEVMRMSF